MGGEEGEGEDKWEESEESESNVGVSWGESEDEWGMSSRNVGKDWIVGSDEIIEGEKECCQIWKEIEIHGKQHHVISMSEFDNKERRKQENS